MAISKTLTELRNGLKGKIYIYLDNTDICNDFFQKAENEGYRLGEFKPTESNCTDIIALDYNKRLSYVNFIGHIAFQCGGGSNHSGIYRIDYRKFLNGCEDYFFKNKIR